VTALPPEEDDGACADCRPLLEVLLDVLPVEVSLLAVPASLELLFVAAAIRPRPVAVASAPAATPAVIRRTRRRCLLILSIAVRPFRRSIRGCWKRFCASAVRTGSDQTLEEMRSSG
jgi:hypothetical protein